MLDCSEHGHPIEHALFSRDSDAAWGHLAARSASGIPRITLAIEGARAVGMLWTFAPPDRDADLTWRWVDQTSTSCADIEQRLIQSAVIWLRTRDTKMIVAAGEGTEDEEMLVRMGLVQSGTCADGVRPRYVRSV